MEASEYWSKVGAPRIRRLLEPYKEAHKLSNSDLATMVEARSGKPAGRAAFEHFVNGVREPYISQLVAICEILGTDVAQIVESTSTVKRKPLIQGALAHSTETKHGSKRAKHRP